MANTSCIFCKIVAGDMPAHKIWEDEKHLAFLSIFPNTEGYTVVIPKQHVGSYAFAQDDEVLSALVLATKKVAHILDDYFADVERCGMFFEGYGVDHLHSKLFPMHGTAGNTEWQMQETTNVTTFFEKYPGYLISNNSHRADDDQLAQLATAINSKNTK